MWKQQRASAHCLRAPQQCSQEPNLVCDTKANVLHLCHQSVSNFPEEAEIDLTNPPALPLPCERQLDKKKHVHMIFKGKGCLLVEELMMGFLRIAFLLLKILPHCLVWP